MVREADRDAGWVVEEAALRAESLVTFTEVQWNRQVRLRVLKSLW